MKILSKSQWENIGKQAGWGKSNDSTASELSQLKHRIAGFIFQLNKKHKFKREEIEQYLTQGNSIITLPLNVNSLNLQQAKEAFEKLEILYKDLERLDKDFAAERPDFPFHQV